MQFIIQLLLFVVPLFVFGFLIGRTVEKRHFRRLEEREANAKGFLITQIKSFPLAQAGAGPPNVVMTEVVIASDYLKSFLSKWRNVFGGELKSFRTLQERAKREAVCRLVDQATAQGYSAMCNVRISGADVGGNTAAGKAKVPMAAVMATATAYHAIPQATLRPEEA